MTFDELHAGRDLEVARKLQAIADAAAKRAETKDRKSDKETDR